jgi:site-specific recombinase XerD
MECLRLRVKDIDFTSNEIVVRSGKGDKDRHTMLPTAVKEPLAKHLDLIKRQHQRDLERGLGRVALPNALGRKYPNAGKEWGWQWVFPQPATTGHRDVSTTMIYTHVLNRGGKGVRSPADTLAATLKL